MLFDEDEAVESCRRRRSPGGCVETSMAGREESMRHLFQTSIDTRIPPQQWKAAKTIPPEKARQGRLHPDDGVETYLATVDTWETAVSSRR
jgi:hypothetical protein